MSKEPLPVHRKVTAPGLRLRKEAGERFAVVTACDYPSARAAEDAGIDVLLVGDSLGMVELGYQSTLPVTMDEMVHHCRAVSRGARRPLLVGDLPFLSYQVSPLDAVRNAGRFVKDGGMDAVKLEGAGPMLGAVRAILDAGVPVMGHVGLTPQSANRLGGYRVQGKDREGARRILEDALALEEAGCFAVVLEAVPARLASLVTARLRVPSIGIGAGAGCDAQVLVAHDLLGLLPGVTARFVKRYESLYERTVEAFSAYRADVESGAFPAAEHRYEMPDEEWRALEASLAAGEPPAPERLAPERLAAGRRRGDGRPRCAR